MKYPLYTYSYGRKKKQTLSRSLLILITIKSHENSHEFQKTSDQLLSIIHVIEIIDHILDPTWIVMDIYIYIFICPSIKNTYQSTIYPSNNKYPQMI